MGKKLSKLTCVGGSSSGSKRMKRRGRPCAETDIDHSVYEPVTRGRAGNNKGLMQNDILGSNTQELRGGQAENGDGAVSGQTQQVVLIPTMYLEPHSKAAKWVDTPNPNADRQKQQKNGVHDVDLLAEANKKIGSSIELLDCPDMSTISAPPETSPEEKGGREAEKGARKKLLTISYGQEGGDLTTVTPLMSNSSNNTLAVPPNSVNSQFLSGIAPLDSLQGDDYFPDITNNSVFEQDFPGRPTTTQSLNDIYFMHVPTGQFYPNNNSILVNPGYADLTTKTQREATGLTGEVSAGPGLDSDFGASAGIEMRIVSSDVSGANDNGSTLKEQSLPATDIVALYGDNIVPVRIANGGGIPGLHFVPGRPAVASRDVAPAQVGLYQAKTLPRKDAPPVALFLHQGRRHAGRRPATISGPEGQPFHVTMEWDPYDTGYGNPAHWREYFIPGVSYPPQLLGREQYWN